MRFLYLLCCLSIYGISIGQNVFTGYVYDAVSKEPLLGASVYYEGTTLGTISNEEGLFRLKSQKQSSSNIVVSYLGYQDAVIAPKETTIKVFLKPALESLNEVVISTNKLFSRKELLKAFKEQFLGNSRAARSCKIKNEAAIFLDYDEKRHQLIADADETIIIENTFLGYEIRYRLYDFKATYFRNTLETAALSRSFYAGTSFYIDVGNSATKYTKRRLKLYKGSTLELMRIIATEKYNEAPYVFYDGSHGADPRWLFKVTDTLGIKKVKLAKYTTIMYDKKSRSAIKPSVPFLIDGYGSFSPPDAVAFGGGMGAQRLGDALPLDYGLAYWVEKD